MFQAMLCDDNEIILEGLSRQIDWEGLGICLSGTAADGQDAWNQMKDNPPDILITDIRMPYIDGLELSRLAKDLNPNIVLLIISAYDDFEYARTAMHLRALDYILKPIDLDAMNRILTNAVSHCRQFHHDKRLMATQLLRNMAVQEAAGPEGIVLNELDLEPDSCCCFLQVELDDHSLSKLSDDIRYASERRFSALSQILFGDSSYLLESHQYSYSVCLTSRSRMELAARRKILVDTIRSSPMRGATAMSASPRAALSRASACSTKVYRPAMKQASFISSRVPMRISFTRRWSLISIMSRRTARDIPYRTPGLLLLSKNKIRRGLQESWSN